MAVYERRRARRPARPAYVPRTDLRSPATERAVNVWGVTDILERAQTLVLDGGKGLSYDELVEVLQLPDEAVPELLEAVKTLKAAQR